MRYTTQERINFNMLRKYHAIITVYSDEEHISITEATDRVMEMGLKMLAMTRKPVQNSDNSSDQ
jgi:microcystin degradation protein MlrC